jgi:hypothetical protein
MHTTKYGNTYTDEVWKEMQAGYKAEEERDNQIQAKIDGMIKYLKRQCKEFGLSESQASTIAYLFETGNFIEANIKFSSKKNEDFVNDLWQRWNAAMNKI